MIAILSEKPSQAMSIADPFPHKKGNGFIQINRCKTFPQGAIVTWAVGHLVELKEPKEYLESWNTWKLEDLPIIPDEFQFKVSEKTQKQFKNVERCLNNANEIIIGTDPAREGENIAYSILMMTGNTQKPIKRLWISSWTKKAVVEGFGNLRNKEESINYFYEAQARQISDWLVGINATRLYTILLQNRGFYDTFSVGRVQTPVLKMIYDREQAIKNFKPEPFFELEALFKVENGEYKGKVKGRFNSKDELYKNFHPHIKDVKQDHEAYIKNVDVSEKRKHAPLLHNLSTLQSKMNEQYKLKASTTLDLVQSLYDKGYLTYPRTDSRYISENEYSYLKEHIDQYQQLFDWQTKIAHTKSSKRFVDSSKVSDHYAIIPTEKTFTQTEFESIAENEKRIYEEIAKVTVGMFMNDFVYDETIVETCIGQVSFISKGHIEKEIGWKTLYKDNSSNKSENKLPALKQGEEAKASLEIKEKKTSPPKRYTEGQLINLMETAGKHIEDKEMRDILNQTQGLGTVATRSDIINKLIESKYIMFNKNVAFTTPKGELLCSAVEGTLLANAEMTAKWEQFLSEIGKGNKSKDSFIKGTKQVCYALIKEANSIIKSLDVKTKHHEMQVHESITKCPKCTNGYIMEKNTKDGVKIYGCSEYKNGCKISFPTIFSGKKLTKTIIKTLCEKKETNNLKGFEIKKGEKFEAKLSLNEEYKLEFIFK